MKGGGIITEKLMITKDLKNVVEPYIKFSKREV